MDVREDAAVESMTLMADANASSVPSVQADVMEDVMRITVKLDGFEGAQSAAYAILWLDKESRRWSREGHQSVDVPDWGALRPGSNGTMILDRQTQQPICVLEQLDVDAPDGPREGLAGPVTWYADGIDRQGAGRWHVQCIDRAHIKAEHGVFAGDEDRWPD